MTVIRLFQNSTFARAAAAIAVAGMLSTGAARACHFDDSGIYVYNDGRNAIYSVHITPVEWDDWGDDLLGNEMIMPEDELVVLPEDFSCDYNYDVLITFETPRGYVEVEMLDVDLCESAGIIADEQNVVSA